MRLQIGNFVSVLDDVLTGKIVAINNDEIIIETDDEMQLSFKENELVLVNDAQDKLSKYLDINNPLLLQKLGTHKPKKRIQFIDNQSVFEVDLHIEQLLNNYKRLDKFEILDYQLDVAKQKLEWAIQKRFPKIVFIHGVGEGILKGELQRLLSRYPVKFYDASYRKYGSGATEVQLQSHEF